jgi:hypothetical protein
MERDSSENLSQTLIEIESVDRRKMLVGGIGVFVSTTAGCLESLSTNFSSESETEDKPPQLPEGMTIETVEIEPWPVQERDPTAVAAVSGEVAAHRRLSVDQDPVKSFVNDTDFTSSYLVAINGQKRPGDRYQVDSIQRTETGLLIDYSAEPPHDTAVRDLAAASGFLIRITDENGAVADTITTRYNF